MHWRVMTWGALLTLLALTACGGAAITPTTKATAIPPSPSAVPITPTNTPWPTSVTYTQVPSTTISSTAVPTAKPTATPSLPTATARPTNIPPPTAVPTIAPAPPTAVPRYASGGLGLIQADWENTYGKPNRDNSGVKSYANDQYVIIYLEGRVSHLERVWGDRDTKTQAFALGAVTPHFPRDAKKVESYISPRSGNPVDRFHSDSLASLFPAANFVGGEPGDFIVIYRMNTAGRVTSAVVGIGNNP